MFLGSRSCEDGGERPPPGGKENTQGLPLGWLHSLGRNRPVASNGAQGSLWMSLGPAQ